MRILVTGANGFVGQILCNTLSQAGHTVVGAVRSAPASASAWPMVCVGDVDEDTDWQTALAEVDVVIHLVARTHVLHETAVDPAALYHRTNVDGTHQLARQAADAGVRRLVFASSIKVNGEATCDTPYRATDVPAPEDDYGRSKWAAEQALQKVAADTGMEWVVVRPPLVYGPQVRGNLLRLLGLAERQRPLPLGSIRNRRSLVSVDNLCDLLRVCIDHPQAAGQTFLVSDGDDLSTPQLVRQLALALDRRPCLVPFPVALLRLAGALLGKQGEIHRLCGSLQVDIEATCKRLDWQPPVPSQETMRRTADWYRQQHTHP